MCVGPFEIDMHGTRKFHAATPSLEGSNIVDEKDILGRPYGKILMEIKQKNDLKHVRQFRQE